MKTALVLGAGGFIGSHMVKRLKSEGYWVRGVDLKYPEFSKTEADEFIISDLRFADHVMSVCRLAKSLKYEYYQQPFEELIHFDEVYQFAADMGGAGYVFVGEHDADIMFNSTAINMITLDTLRRQEFKGKLFYSSSACVYPQELQTNVGLAIGTHNLAEHMAIPANPDSAYGWEKLFSERLFLAYHRCSGLDVRIARFHNIYGPEGTYKGGKEKAPAAMCRKVIESKGEIEIWGDGEQTRSFLYVDDCVDAVRLLMNSEYREPINIGSEEMVTINHLADLAIRISEDKPKPTIKHIDGPQGVRGRNSDNTLIRGVLGWSPKFRLVEGLIPTFKWILSQYPTAS